VIKTVLELDLVGYSSVARMLEENNGAGAVAALNDQVQRFVDDGLRAVQLPRDGTVMATTGDGAILLFEKADQAHRFATALSVATKEHNASRTEASARRRFRVGAATGEIVLRPQPGGGHDMAGITIANAVRLEAAGRPGTLLIDLATHNALPSRLQALYGPEEEVAGKRDEKFRARRCVFDPDDAAEVHVAPPQPKPAAGDRRAIVSLLERLYPEDKLTTLLFLLEMPAKRQPSRALPLAERRAEVLNWAASPGGCRLDRLESELRYLLESQSP
jgi:class 3 adenylate cyclase